MLSVQENQRLTRVGAGTPMGELMRQYWHPVAATVELAENPTKAVRILGENLVLYKDRSGRLGLVQEACPHRRVNLLYGIPEEHGLRCPYHGWLFDETGRCLEQPAEAPDSTFKDRVKAVAYPVQELGGLVWAYLGSEPVPLLPRWDLLVWDNVLRDIGLTVLPCNWLQCMENSLDPVHTEWLHAYQTNYVLGQQRPVRHHGKIGFDVFEYGVIKRRTYAGMAMEGGTSEEDSEWRIGHPIIFPNILRVGTSFEFRVPIDDTHTYHVAYSCYVPPPDLEVPKQETIPIYEIPYSGENGKAVVDYVLGQDMMAWWTQGPVAERPVEKLAESDKGIVLYRRLLKEQMRIVQDGGEPMNTFRDPAGNKILNLFQEQTPAGQGFWLAPRSGGGRKYSPVPSLVEKLSANIR